MSNQNITEYGRSHGSLKSYIIGFIGSILLTIIPFYLAMTNKVNSHILIGTIIITAILQLLIQLICFLHLNHESHPRWNLTAFIFTMAIVVFIVAASIWIMWNLDYNMMF